MSSYWNFTGLALLTLLVCSLTRAERPPARSDAGKRITAPVFYKDLLLVITTSDGVAAVTFTEEIRDTVNQRFGVNYRYRYQAKAGAKEESGTGKVFEQFKRRADGDVISNGGELFLTAGPIKLEWSLGGPGKGWVYYVPEQTRVQIANAEDYDKFDLQRFAK